MSKPKLTPWFHADVKPVHVGVYETRDEDFHLAHYQFWDGKKWGLYSFDVKKAYKGRKVNSCYQFVEWRGLAEQPK